jgi:magnesium-transporting ATPase (P-type)
MASLPKMDESGQKAHTVSPNQLMQMLGTTTSGLSEEQSTFKMEAHGPNELPREEPKSLLRMILHQFEDLLVRILLIAAVVSFVSFGWPNMAYFDSILSKRAF